MNFYRLLLATVFLFGCSGAVRTSISPEERTYIFDEQILKSKAETFDAVDEWFAVNTKNYKDVVQLKDKETGKLIAKLIMDVSVGLTKLPMNYVLIIRISDKEMTFNFEIGKMATSYGGYPPESSIVEIENEFIEIKNSILSKIKNY